MLGTNETSPVPLCAPFMKGVVVGVLTGVVVVALIEVHDRMRMKARNKNNKNAAAAPGTFLTRYFSYRRLVPKHQRRTQFTGITLAS